MRTDHNSKVVLALVRKALQPDFIVDPALIDGADWNAVAKLATIHGVNGLVLPEIEALPTESRPPMPILLSWFGQVSKQEQVYEKHKAVIAELASLYASEGIRMLLLKGYGLSLEWPQPDRRPVGDIDIYNFGQWKKADQLVAAKLGVKVESGHEHHTTITYKGILVENHYDFINTKAHKDAPTIEAYLKALANNFVVADPEIPNLYYPSAAFNIIFLIRHLGQHFAGENITLRQLVDWGLYIQNHSTEVHWDVMLERIESMGIKTFFHQINAICVDYLGFDESHFPAIERNVELEERILQDILSPEFAEEKPDSGLFRILAFKFRRWWHNRWKHPLVYNEWLLPMFLTLLWSKLSRIETIKD